MAIELRLAEHGRDVTDALLGYFKPTIKKSNNNNQCVYRTCINIDLPNNVFVLVGNQLI